MNVALTINLYDFRIIKIDQQLVNLIGKFNMMYHNESIQNIFKICSKKIMKKY